MENELSSLWKYTNKLENLLIEVIKENSRFKKNVKSKLKK